MFSDPPEINNASPDEREQVTRLLNAAVGGDAKAPNELFELIYDQLRSIARQRMSTERPNHTLQTTALVNEAYIRLMGKPGAAWNGRGHFFAAAAQAMRRILIDHFRTRSAGKRGGGGAALSISSVADFAESTDPAGFLALDDAISRLEEQHPLSASVVRLRFYAGLQFAEVAEALSISERTARREWTFARGWLRDVLERERD